MHRSFVWAGLIAVMGWALPQIAVGQSAEAPRGGIDLFSLQAAPPGARSVASGTNMRIRGFGIYSTADGKLNFGDDIPGVTNDLDLESTLGMDMETFTGGLVVGFDFGSEQRWHFDLGYLGHYDYDGNRVVGTIEFNGNIYVGQVGSSLTLDEGIVRFGYDFWRADGADLTLTGLLDVHIYYVQAEIRAALTGRSDEVDLLIPVPAPGISLRYGLTPNIYVRGTATGLYLGELASYVDLSAEVGYDINQNVGLFLGYRYWYFSFDWDDNEFNMDNSSIYAGVELRF